MIQIGETIISDDVLEKQFVCDLKACKGICCVEGESGAPLEEEELFILEDIYEKVKPYMRVEGIAAVEEQGTHVIDSDKDYVTPLVNGAECAYAIFEKDGTAKCAIEQAHINGEVDFQKPISCHLYPIRIDKYKNYDAINYHAWEICSPACTLGKELQVPTYKFVKAALIRKYGEEWYGELEEVAAQLGR